MTAPRATPAASLWPTVLWARFGLFGALVALTLLCACGKAARALATLESKQGNVERDRSTAVGTFQPAGKGDAFFLGDGVRTGDKATASLRLLDGSSLGLEERTLIRFLAQASKQNVPKVDLEFGQAIVTASNSPLTIETNFGNAVIQPNGTLRFARIAAGARFEVTVGTAVLDVGDKHAEISPSSNVEVSADGNIVDPAKSVPPLSSADKDRVAESARLTYDFTLEVEADGARIRDDVQAPFRPLTRGTTPVASGNVVDLPAGVTARLHAQKNSTRLAGPAQFAIGDHAGALVRTQSGEMELAPTESTVSVTVPGGTIRAQVGSRANLRTDKAGTTVRVVSGKVTVDGSAGGEVLEGGEEALLEKNGKVRRSRSRGLDHADIVVQAGESFSVHDPTPPTAVGIGITPACDGTALLDIAGRGKRQLAGQKTINVELQPGTYGYSVRCIDAQGAPSDIVAKGSVSVLADAGTRQIAAHAPATFIDIDGRNYTILYQSKLPSIVARWPNAPGVGPFNLVVRNANGQKRNIRAEKAAYTFDPGTLGEGKHLFTFGTDQRRSKPTEVNIVFDNATPAASIGSPANGSFEAGGQVQVAGMALPSSSVSVDGVVLTQDDQHRFQGTAKAPTAQKALAIRFSHPARGTHYYLRRPAATR